MRIYELNPRFDARKSFYGKAHVIDYENGTLELLSYNTIVSRCINGKVEELGKWSNTTTRHQKEFRRQFENRHILGGTKNGKRMQKIRAARR